MKVRSRRIFSTWNSLTMTFQLEGPRNLRRNRVYFQTRHLSRARGLIGFYPGDSPFVTSFCQDIQSGSRWLPNGFLDSVISHKPNHSRLSTNIPRTAPRAVSQKAYQKIFRFGTFSTAEYSVEEENTMQNFWECTGNRWQLEIPTLEKKIA